jgi:hypothetical protein
MPYGYDVANIPIPQAANPLESVMGGAVKGIDLGLGLQRAKQDAQLNQLQQQNYQQELDQKKSEGDLKKFGELTSFYKNLKNPRNKEIFYESGIKPLAEKIFGTQLPSMLDEKTSSYFDDAGELGQHLKDGAISLKDYKIGLQSLYMKALKEGDEESAKGLLESSKMISDPVSQNPSYTFQGFSGKDPVFSSNKSTQLITGTGVTGNSFIPKNEPAKLVEQQADLKNQSSIVTELRDKLAKIPDSLSGAASSAAATLTGGILASETKAYNDYLPAAAVKIYRAMTGDTRLSDADAAARAYPLIPKPWEPLSLRESKLKDIDDAISGRNDTLKSILMGTANLPNKQESSPVPGFTGDKEKRYQEWKKKQLMGK